MEMTRPALLGAGAGTLLAGTGVATCGVVGAPCVGGAVFVPAVAGWRHTPVPPSGEWESASSEFQSGYITGFQDTAQRRQMRSAGAGGLVGAAVGTGLGIGTIFLAQSWLAAE